MEQVVKLVRGNEKEEKDEDKEEMTEGNGRR